MFMLSREAGMEVYSDVYDNAISNTDAGLYGALPLVMERHLDRHPEFLQPLHRLVVQHR